MTAFAQQTSATAAAEFESSLGRSAQRPPRWSIANWPVRWKVFAIVLVPLLLAGTFGGLRVYSGWVGEADLTRAADRAAVVPATEQYVAALESALLANSTGADLQPSIAEFDSAKQNLQRRSAAADVDPDVEQGITGLLDGGQALLDKVTANSIGLRERITTYAPILLTAENVVNGSVQVGDENIRTQALGLSRAMGARGQMMMEQLLVNRGDELPEPEQRTAMMTLAGTEPSALFGISQAVGVGSPEAQKLQEEYVKRTSIVSDPAVPLVGNPELTASLRATSDIAEKVIGSTKDAVAGAVVDQARGKRNEAIRDSVIVGAAILVALLIVTLVARTLTGPLRRLRDGALKVAHEDLARELERLRAGEAVADVEPLPVHTTEEIGQLAHAVDELHEQAVLLAGEQVNLQIQVDDMFETLSRRNRSLVDQQLALIDRLERDERDPERLETLFRLDHLAARMRRNGANLLVLSGARVPREQADPVPVAGLIDAAASEVEDYARLTTASVVETDVSGTAAGDLVHLLAELLDNALRYSPPSSRVRVSAVRTGNGALVVEIIDAGLGMTDSDLRVANVRLQSGGEVNPYTARHMGLFVVGRLAAQHGLVVRLRHTVVGNPDAGTTAGVCVPGELLVEEAGGHPAESAWDDVDPARPRADAAANRGYDQYDEQEPFDQAGRYDEQEPFDQAGRYDEREFFEPARYDEPARDDEPAPYDQPVPCGDRLDEPRGGSDAERATAEHRNGHFEAPISFLPQRNPGASGISGIPLGYEHPRPANQPEASEQGWPQDSPPGPAASRPEPPRPAPPPVDTSAFFASREQVQRRTREQGPSNGAHASPGTSAAPPPVPSRSAPPPPPATPPAPRPATEPVADDAADVDGSIFSKMLSEWLIDDPVELAASTDLDWHTVWDQGWSAAAAAADAPVDQRTEDGLPIRHPGARLVPGGTDESRELRDRPERSRGPSGNGRHRNGDEDNGGPNGGPNGEVPHRNPDAVRDMLGNHFGGVRAGRASAGEDGKAERR